MNEESKCIVCSQQARFMCSSCGPPVFYCSEDCQKSDWTLQHKNICKAAVSAHQSIQGNIKPPLKNEDDQRAALKKRGKFAKLFKRKTSSQSVEPTNPTIQIEDEIIPMTEEEQAQDLKFYMQQVYLILKPVMICIILSIMWVKFTTPVEEYYDFRTNAVINTPGGSAGGVPSAGGSVAPPTGDEFATSLKLALIILSQIIVATIVILILFKYGCMKILYGIFGTIVLVLLGLFGYLLGSQLLSVFNLALDWISFVFFLWNLVVVGLVQIFWKGPMRLQQAYLVLMSSLMAYSLTQTLELTTWILLGLLAVWDLIAVLAPYGPLRLLVESSRDQEREIPALLYSGMSSHVISVVMIWMMVSPPAGDAATSLSNRNHSIDIPLYDIGSAADSHIAPPLKSDTISDSMAQAGEASDNTANQNTVLDEEVERAGLKLGLGDFVFYSVLVARGGQTFLFNAAALFDWTTTISCTVAVMTGLKMTIFLLAIYRKALPALPISIAFGILFYFLSSRMLTPFVNSLIILPDYTTLVGIEIGKVGGGMIYI